METLHIVKNNNVEKVEAEMLFSNNNINTYKLEDGRVCTFDNLGNSLSDDDSYLNLPIRRYGECFIREDVYYKVLSNGQALTANGDMMDIDTAKWLNDEETSIVKFTCETIRNNVIIQSTKVIKLEVGTKYYIKFNDTEFVGYFVGSSAPEWFFHNCISEIGGYKDVSLFTCDIINSLIIKLY